jgi:peptidoglycan-associated lipoprotein
MHRQIKLVIAATLALALAACASKAPPAEVKTADPTPPPVTQPPPAQTEVKPVIKPPVIAVDPTKDPSNILSTRIIYFEYDKDEVKSEFQSLVQAHAKYLTENRGRKIRLEGHADERGSREYNIALGQRRADAVRKAASVLGVDKGRVETISFGEEKPAVQGHNEAAWSKNRRVVIVYDGE